MSVNLIHVKASYKNELRRLHFASNTSLMGFVDMLQHEYGVPVVVAYKGEGSEDLLTITTEVDYRRFILYSERQQLVRLTVTEATPENLAYVPAAHVPMAPRGLGKNVLDLKISLGGGSAAEPHARQHQPLRLPIALPAPIHHPPTQAPKQPLLPPPPPPAVRMEQFTGGLTELDVKLLDIVGNGAFGVVHRALRCRDGLDMAVKTMLVDVKPEGQKQILIELHVPPLAVHQWMDCGSLDAVAKAGLAIPEPILGYISFSVLSGLVYLMESLHVMHRDIKPSNILLNSRGNVRLCDFGVSTMLTNSLRHAVTYIGTNAYMAPEKITGEEYTILSDVWSLGISLVELAMGKFPFDVVMAAPFELLTLIVNTPSPSLPADSFSAHACSFVQQCVIKDTNFRPGPQQLLAHPFVSPTSIASQQTVAQFAQSYLKLKQL